MSLLRLPKFRGLTSTLDGVRNRFSGRTPQSLRERVERRLLIDPLEERQLLSLTPANYDDIRVEAPLTRELDIPEITAATYQGLIDQGYVWQTKPVDYLRYNETQYTEEQQSVAIDDDGDFVVTWTSYDYIAVTLPGQTANTVEVLFDSSGAAVTEANIYARYFTDEVQELVLPEDVLDDNVAGQYATMSLTYGGDEVQKITLTSGYQPGTSGSLISGQYTLGVDTGGGVIVPTTVNYDETAPMGDNVEELRYALSGIPGLGDVVVEAINAHEFLIHFEGDVSGQNVPELTVTDTSGLSGFLPTVLVETVNEPVVLNNILISPDNPALTALSIQQAFLRTTDSVPYGPIDFPPPDRVPSLVEGPYTEPEIFTSAMPQVSVRSVATLDDPEGLLHFEITFVGDAAKQDHPELVINSITDDQGNTDDDLGNSLVSLASISTIKETSAEFRVNPIEEDNPFTLSLDRLDQYSASVAMDSDGEFVIAWEGVADYLNEGSVVDVYARRFTATGVVAEADVEFTQGVRALVSSEAEVVQLLSFQAAGSTLEGVFALRIGNRVTDSITFDSNDLEATAENIASALEDEGFEEVSVTVASTSNPYTFEVSYLTTYGELNGWDDALLEYIPVIDPDTSTTLAATVNIVDHSEDLYTIQVNQDMTNAQYSPTVGMDADGNFVIAWANGGQDLSYFNGIRAQWFDRHGNRIENEVNVNDEITAINIEPYVVMSDDGHTLITWTETEDPSYVVSADFASSVFAKVYDPAGNVLLSQFGVGGGGDSAAAFDYDNNFVIVWDAIVDVDNFVPDGYASVGVRAIEYDITGTILRDEFRANSASTNPDSETPLWPFGQFSASVAIDADGDMVISYDGYGPDTSENVAMAGEYFSAWINDDKNDDLKQFFFDPDYDILSSLYPIDNNGDVDGVIEAWLIYAANNGANTDQLARLSAILNDVASLLRGEANGIMFSTWDSDPNLNSQLTTLSSDNVANNTRDGRNTRTFLQLDPQITGGSFNIVINPGSDLEEVVTVTVVMNDNDTVNRTETANAIEDALEAAIITGVNWPENEYEGPVEVRLVGDAEVTAREGTPWELDWGTESIIYEITFQGEVHDTEMYIDLADNGNNLEGVRVEEVQILTITDIAGTPPNGNFILIVDGEETNTLSFNGGNPGATANSVQGALEALGYEVTVEYDPLSTWSYTITFVGASAGEDIPLIEFELVLGEGETAQITGSVAPDTDGDILDAPNPGFQQYTYGYEGTTQYNSTLAMEPDGDFVLVWTQADELSYDYSYSNDTIYYRRSDETTDTAGPQITDVVAPDGSLVDDGATIRVGSDGLTYLVLTFSEDMMKNGDDSVTNIENYVLRQNGTELDGAIVNVQYGLNMASQLAGQINPLTGEAYDLDSTATNKWEVVFTLDGDLLEDGVQGLSTGRYTIEALTPVLSTDPNEEQSGLRDAAGNPLGYTGYTPDGANFSSEFVIAYDSSGDTPVNPDDPDDPNPPTTIAVNGQTYPETPGAVAVDGDGDHVAVWTAYDTVANRDRVYVAMYDANGSVADLDTNGNGVIDASEVDSSTFFAVTTDSAFDGDDQRFASVAMDADGDFVVTWTNYHEGEADIYMRRFSSDGTALGEAQLVNSYTTDDQVWSNVAMDVDGDIVITWSSHGQEDNGQNGYGYGVYARRYDSNGQALAPEFQVNVTTAGDQQFSSVSMDAEGNFVVVWQSDQGGTGDNIYAREFNADGSPRVSPLTGEIRVNDTTAGNQTYPDVAMDLAGDNYVVTWTSTQKTDDTSGTAVYAKLLTTAIADSSAPSSGETLINDTTSGDQRYSSVAMNYAGDFVITWSGYGNQINQEDKSESGVFAKTYAADFTELTSETRLNSTVTGRQWIASVGCDAEGNFVAVWTGDGASPGTTDVYRYVSSNVQPVTDTAGPIITDVFLPDGTRVLENGYLPTGVTQLVVTFSEQPNLFGGSEGLNSVLDPSNWILVRDGDEIPLGVSDVSFEWNVLTRKYEATITLDYNGPSTGIIALQDGNYTLVVRDLIDDGINALDGDFDGEAGTSASATGYDGYAFNFTVGDSAQSGAEKLVNVTTSTEQRLATGDGTAQAREETSRSVAVDNDGDYVVVWTTYNATTGADIYYRVFDRNDNPITGELRANTTTIGDQVNASVAIDADGDFVIVWESTTQDIDGSSGIYARRFDAMGNAVVSDTNFDDRIDARDTTDEFLVPTNYTNDQVNASVTMSDGGAFVIVWAGSGQAFSWDNNVYGQMFDSRGVQVGDEFLVNSGTVVGANSAIVGGFEVNPDVTFLDSGNFVVAWDVVTSQSNGVITDTAVVARMFNNDGTAQADEFWVDNAANIGDDTDRAARNPQLASDNDGNFIIVWEGSTGTDYDIFYQLYNANGATQASGQANQTQLTGDQVNPTVAMDADGDFVIAWNGTGGQPDALNPSDSDLVSDQDAAGVFIRYFNSDGDPVSVQTRVNSTTNGIQRLPSVAMEPDGDVVVVWCGQGVGDMHGIFSRRYNEPTDTAGPLPTELWDENGNQIHYGDNIFFNPQSLIAVFDEAMSTVGGTTGTHSVTNPNNWALLDSSGNEISNIIDYVTFSFNNATNKWEAEIYFDGNGAGVGTTPLANGTYTLVARSALQDASGNALARTGVWPSGTALLSDGSDPVFPITSPTGGLEITFRVHDTTPGDASYDDLDTHVNTTTDLDQDDVAVARNSWGDYVVVWTTESTDGTTDIVAQRYDAMSRKIGGEIIVNSVTTGNQAEPAVAIDDDGNFTVVWSGQGVNDAYGIFAQRFDAQGELIGGQFQVNTEADNVQDKPSIAMTSDGRFVISYTSASQDGYGDGIFARVYNANAQPLDAEFQVNTHTNNWQDESDVAIDEDGNFVVVWQSELQDGSSWGIYAQRFDAAGNAVGSEFRVNSYTSNDQIDPAVAMDDDGDFVVVWSSLLQDGSGYGVYGQRFNANGKAQGAEFRANEYTQGYQYQPDVSMDPEGNYVVTWASFGQDDNPSDNSTLTDYGIYAHMYNADGSEFEVDGTDVGEFRVNSETDGTQTAPAVSRDADGHYVIAWTGVDRDTDGNILSNTGVFSQLLDPPVETVDEDTYWEVFATTGDDAIEFIAGDGADNWIVRINGVEQTIPSTVVTLVIYGRAGNDTVTFTGTAGDETLVAGLGSYEFSGTNFTVTVTDAEVLRANAGSGNDTAVLTGTDGNDTFIARPTSVSLVGPGLDIITTGFESTTANAGEGNDVAKLFDSAGDDTLVSQQYSTTLSGTGFELTANNFDAVHGYATAGGNDVAYLYDSAGNDHFDAYPTDAALYGDGFYNRAKSFDSVYAYANNGGLDEAKLYDSEGNDYFHATPDLGVLHGDGFFNQAEGFDGVHAYAKAGGYDEAKLLDSEGNDKYYGNWYEGILYGDGFYNRAKYFEAVRGYALYGGVDEAKLIDSSQDDTFYASATEASMYSDAYYHRAKNFEGVHAYALYGGIDTAFFVDSEGDDMLVADSQATALFGNGFYNRAKFFEKQDVQATNGGNDKALLIGSSLLETGKTDKSVGEGADYAKVAWLFDFEELGTKENASSDEVAQSVDAVMTAYWSNL